MLLRIWAPSLLFACLLALSPHATFPQPALDSFVWVRTPPNKHGRLLLIINKPAWGKFFFFRQKVSAHMSAERLSLCPPLNFFLIACFPSLIASRLPNSLNHRVEHNGFMITLVTSGCCPIRLLGFLAQGFMRGGEEDEIQFARVGFLMRKIPLCRKTYVSNETSTPCPRSNRTIPLFKPHHDQNPTSSWHKSDRHLHLIRPNSKF